MPFFAKYFIRRLGAFLFAVWGAYTIAFAFFHLIPGDPINVLVATMGQTYGATGAQVTAAYNAESGEAMAEAFRARFGLDRSLPEQYVLYLRNILLRGELGPSLLDFPNDAKVLILRALPWTIGLLGVSVVIAWTLGLVVGVLVGWLRDTVFGNTVIAVSLGLAQVPSYLMALFLILSLAYGLALFPGMWAYDPTLTPGLNWAFIVSVIQHSFLPAASIVIVTLAGWIISTRSLVVGILGEDYLVYARAKGLPNNRVLNRYVLRNALLPQVTGLGMSLGFALNGSLLVEALFVYPGLGRLLQVAIQSLDYNVVQGIILISIVAVLAANLVIDLILPLVDPRVRYGD